MHVQRMCYPELHVEDDPDTKRTRRSAPHPEVKAARAGMKLSDYLLSEIELVAEKPTMKEWLDKVSRDDPRDLG